MWSRPGQITTSSPPAGSTAIGASAPYSSRSEAARGAVVRAARNRSPSSAISCAPDCRHASAMAGADSPATSRTATSICSSARPTAGLPSWTTTRTSARSSRVSSAVSSVSRSSSRAQMTAIAPARPASVSVAAARELAARCGTPHPASWRASAGSGWSSTTTAGTPDWLSSSTMRRPTKRRPHTITWPRQSAHPPVTRASSRFSMTQMLAARMRGMIIPGATWPPSAGPRRLRPPAPAPHAAVAINRRFQQVIHRDPPSAPERAALVPPAGGRP